MLTRIKGGFVLLTLAVLASLLAPGASSAPGVGVSLGSIEVTERLEPGSDYDLPEVTVINTGDETREYELSLQTIDAAGVKDPEAKWFHFEPASFVLAPGESKPVATRIVVPAGAEPGDYAAHLEAHPITAGSFTISVAAATKLSFSVAEAGWFDSQVNRVNRWLDDYSPWTYLLPVAALAGILVVKAGGRLPFRVRLERK